MLSFICKRTLAAILLTFVVTSFVFLALYLVPGDPAAMLLSVGDVTPPAQAVEALRIELGLDKPILLQYFTFLGDALQGDLGHSFFNRTPVLDTILLRLPRTLELMLAATVISLAVGIPAGLAAALRQGKALDRFLSLLASVAISVPIFVIGTAMIYFFAQKLHLVPAGGFVRFSQDPIRHLLLLLMPALALSVGFSATIFRMTRTTVATVLTMDWVRTARAKGISERLLMRRHVVRNALGPVATIVGLEMGGMLGGSVLIEYVFNWPGLGSYLITAIENRDYPQVRGTVLVVATMFIFLNLLIDLLYAVLDPRVRY
ncbi:ABC transporter permease [Paracoccus pantotrophus]|uniref:ABC transporter permease n=1 Tax=Paracoccus pantotrophus TaxID=82367 RepID=UPI0008F2087B|nr:ABC transporter permease [Paracoccus pantotrophus]MDF3855772.1 ABC transporter permease [Paracoccus pantotrophus]SFP25324.1 peptide/nickel transport system permease protein [Paracoccus pantotrophus]